MKKIICLLLFSICCSHAVYAMDLDGVKEHFLKSEWKDAIREGETLMAGAARDSSDLDRLYYYLGLCYFKDKQFLRSADIFEIILKEFPKSTFAEPALHASIESYSSAGDHESAFRKSQLFLKTYPQSLFVNEVARQLMFNKLQIDKQNAAGAPVSEPTPSESDPDLVLASDLMSGKANVTVTQSFWIQVGAFSSYANADNLASKLRAASYMTGVAQSWSKGKSIYKVRVGPYYTREEAQAVSRELSRQRYPTKVVP